RYAEHSLTALVGVIIKKADDSVSRSQLVQGTLTCTPAAEYRYAFHRCHVQLCAKMDASALKSRAKFNSGRIFAHFRKKLCARSSKPDSPIAPSHGRPDQACSWRIS